MARAREETSVGFSLLNSRMNLYLGPDNWSLVEAEDWTTGELGHSGLGEFEDNWSFKHQFCINHICPILTGLHTT